MESYVLRRADAVTTICDGLRRDILGRGLPAEKVTVVPNAVDAERSTTERQVDGELRRSLGLHERIVLGFIRSFYAHEGLNLLMDAVVRLFRGPPGGQLLVVAGGTAKDRHHRRGRG